MFPSLRRLARSETISILPPRLDYKPLLASLSPIKANASNRNAPISKDQISQAAVLAERRRLTLNQVFDLRAQRSLVGERVRKGEPNAKQDAKRIKDELHSLEPVLSEIEHALLNLTLHIPNDTHPDTPLGPECNARLIETIGCEPIPSDPNRDHLIVGRELGIIDFETASVVTGSNWYFLRGAGTILEQALQSYALSVAVRHGFTPASCPDVIRSDIAGRCGFSPRERDGSSQAYQIRSPTPESPQLSLAATAEIPLAGSFFNRTFYHQELPQKVVGVGKAYRTETSAGADVRGLYRVHQFSKVELFVVSDQENSEKEMEHLVEVQREIVQGLGLSVRVLDMPTEELGASAYRKYDMEAWMPGKGSWGEVSSTSNCTSYQSRRLLITYKTPPSPYPSDPLNPSPPLPATTFAHTLNGTAAAIPRLIVALLENGVVFDEKSRSDDKPAAFDSRKKVKLSKAPGARKEALDEGLAIEAVRLPSVLRRFWIGDEKIGPVEIIWV